MRHSGYSALCISQFEFEPSSRGSLSIAKRRVDVQFRSRDRSAEGYESDRHAV